MFKKEVKFFILFLGVILGMIFWLIYLVPKSMVSWQWLCFFLPASIFVICIIIIACVRYALNFFGQKSINVSVAQCEMLRLEALSTLPDNVVTKQNMRNLIVSNPHSGDTTIETTLKEWEKILDDS